MGSESKSKSGQMTKNPGCGKSCEKEIRTKRTQVNEHISSSIPLLQPDYKCSHCDFMSNFKSRLAVHMQTHKNQRPGYKCPEPNCASVFTRWSTLKNHLLCHNREETLLPLKCVLCSFKTACPRHLKSHMRSHWAEVKQFSCDLCPFKTHQQLSIIAHQRFAHSTVKPFKCPQPNCSHSCKRRSCLTEHMKVHSVEVERVQTSYGCFLPTCNFSTESKTALEHHELDHQGDSLFKCFAQNCNYFGSQENEPGVSGQGQTSSPGKDEKTLDGEKTTTTTATMGDMNMNGVSHIKWSVDWGRFGYQAASNSSKLVIKVEEGTFCWQTPLPRFPFFGRFNASLFS